MESYAEEHPVAELSENAMDIAAIDVLTPTQAARYLSVILLFRHVCCIFPYIEGASH